MVESTTSGSDCTGDAADEGEEVLGGKMSPPQRYMDDDRRQYPLFSRQFPHDLEADVFVFTRD